MTSHPQYNADSASALLECGMIQGKWGEAVGLSCVGRDVGEGLFNQLGEVSLDPAWPI